MKKSLVLAMAMALGVTASAYAANPFSDVPAGHWAYDSISKLAAAGIIEGYGDDTFRGDRLMTRYEMAQIVAKALAKGANVDKLAAEFADELDALGVRVAALEKKSDNVKITGQARYHYASYKDGDAKTHSHKLRSRIWFTGKVNNTWDYVGMLQNEQDFTNNVGDETTDFQRAYLQGRLGGVKVIGGRYNKTRLAMGDQYGTRFDGIDFTYGKKVKLNAYYGKPTNMKAIIKSNVDKKYGKADSAWGVNVSADLGKVATLFAGYDEYKASDVGITDADGNVVALANGKDKVFDVGVDFKLGKDFKLGATYLHAKLDGKVEGASNNGVIVAASYKGAVASKPGSWGLAAKYYHTPAGFFVAPGWEDGHSANANAAREGAKGFYAKANYTVAKNIVAGVEYWDLKTRETEVKSKTLFTGLYFSF